MCQARQPSTPPPPELCPPRMSRLHSMLPPAAEHQTKAIAMDVKLFGKSRVAGQGSHRSEVGKVVIMILFRRVEERVFRSSSWKPIDPLAPVVASPVCIVGWPDG